MIFAFFVCFGLKIMPIVFERKKGTMNPELSACKQVLLEMFLHIQKGSVCVCITIYLQRFANRVVLQWIWSCLFVCVFAYRVCVWAGL